MISYSGVIGKNELVAIKSASRSFYKLNFVLLFIAVGLAVVYIFLANFLVAQKYSLNLARTELTLLNSQANSQNQYGLEQDVESIMSFAKKSGMIEAKDQDSILQNNSFALIPPN